MYRFKPRSIPLNIKPRVKDIISQLELQGVIRCMKWFCLQLFPFLSFIVSLSVSLSDKFFCLYCLIFHCFPFCLPSLGCPVSHCFSLCHSFSWTVLQVVFLYLVTSLVSCSDSDSCWYFCFCFLVHSSALYSSCLLSSISFLSLSCLLSCL